METIVVEILKFAKRKLEKNTKNYKILDKLKLTELKPDFDSIYKRTLIEYGVEKYPPEFCYLFAEPEVINAFKEELYENNEEIFFNVINNTFKTIYEKKLKDEQIHSSDMDLPKEIESFKNIFKQITNTTKTPKELELFNEITKLKIDSMKRSFYFQAERYLKYLINEFKKEFPDNKYITQKGEIRILKKYTTKEEMESHSRINDMAKITSTKEDKIEKIPLDPIDKYISTWLNNDKQNLLIILGEYGTGKTSLCKHIAKELASNYFDENTKIIKDKGKRIVFLLNLRNFKAEEVEKYIIAELNENGIQDFNKPDLYKRIDKKELIFIFDGFDEMTQKIDTEEKKANFLQIEKLINERKNSKVILTSREEYFTYDKELNEVFRNDDNDKYQIIYLNLFDDEQIKAYLKTHTDNPKFYLDKIKKIYDLGDLAPRPVLLDFIVKYLPRLIKEKGDDFNINASDLYEMGIRSELEKKTREVPFLKYKLPTPKRLALLQRLAIWMYENNTLTIDTTIIKEALKLEDFFEVKKDYELIKYLNMFLNFTFLIKESDYIFRISHKSFRDYLVARELVKEINNGKINIFGKYQTGKEINHFISEMEPDREKLLQLVKTETTEQKKWQKSNAVNLILKIDNKDFNRNVDFSEKRIDLYKSNLSNISVLSELKKISKLRLHNNQIIAIKPLKELKNLTELWLSDNQITDIQALQELKNLTELILLRNQITDIQPLQELKNLTILFLSSNQITNINPLKKLKNLTKLLLFNNRITDIKALKELKNLTELWLSENQIMDIQPLQKLKNLTKLWLYDNQITDIKPLQELKNLTELWLSDNQITDIKPLQKLKILTELNLSRNQITDIQPLQELKNLTNLWLYNNQITDIAPLKKLKKLTILLLSNNKIADIQPLQKLKNLTELDLSFNQINDIKSLKDLTKLTELDLSVNQISDIEPLKQLNNLNKLSLSDNEINNIEPLKELKNLTELDLSGNPLSSSQIKELRNALKKTDVIFWS